MKCVYFEARCKECTGNKKECRSCPCNGCTSDCSAGGPGTVLLEMQQFTRMFNVVTGGAIIKQVSRFRDGTIIVDTPGAIYTLMPGGGIVKREVIGE